MLHFTKNILIKFRFSCRSAAGTRRVARTVPASNGRGQQLGPIRPRPGQRIEGAGAPMPRESGPLGPAASGGDGVAVLQVGRWRTFPPYRVFL